MGGKDQEIIAFQRRADSGSQTPVSYTHLRSPELEEKLAAPGKEKMLEECLGISNLALSLIHIWPSTSGPACPECVPPLAP